MKTTKTSTETPQPGFVVRYSFYGPTYTKVDILKTTPTGIRVVRYPSGEEVRFAKDGSEIGNRYQHVLSDLPYEEVVEKIEFTKRKEAAYMALTSVNTNKHLPSNAHRVGKPELLAEVERLERLLAIARGLVDAI